MNIIITGGLGFVGRQLAVEFLARGDSVTIIDLPEEQSLISHENLHYISADTTIPGDWQHHVSGSDVIINLAGITIFKRWTKSFKKKIYDSRILTTRNIADAMPKGRNITFLSTSAVGFYGWRDDETLTEGDSPGHDYLSKVCQDWEAEALRAKRNGIRVVITRFGLVLGKSGGVLGSMIPLFSLCLGGTIGKGKQWFSWIHGSDLINGIIHILETDSIKGPVNLCAPTPVTNKTFTRTLAKILRRPSFMFIPSFVLKLVLGEFADNIINGQRVVPAVLLKNGFSFRYADIETALSEILQK